MKQCSYLQMGNRGGYAIVCGDAPRVHKCDFCHKRDGENQCDYPTGGKCKKCKGVGSRKPNDTEQMFEQRLAHIISGEWKGSPISADQARQDLITLQKSYVCHPCAGTGKAMCNRYFCGKTCGVRVSADEGYCPDHMERAGKTRPVVKEQCWWIDEAKYFGKCLRASCNTQIELGDRVLYFPERRRVMDEECGEEYLKIAIEPI